jgi:hypothetical protein
MSDTWVAFTQAFASTVLGSWELGPTPGVGKIGLGWLELKETRDVGEGESEEKGKGEVKPFGSWGETLVNIGDVEKKEKRRVLALGSTKWWESHRVSYTRYQARRNGWHHRHRRH